MSNNFFEREIFVADLPSLVVISYEKSVILSKGCLVCGSKRLKIESQKIISDDLSFEFFPVCGDILAVRCEECGSISYFKFRFKKFDKSEKELLGFIIEEFLDNFSTGTVPDYDTFYKCILHLLDDCRCDGKLDWFVEVFNEKLVKYATLFEKNNLDKKLFFKFKLFIYTIGYFTEEIFEKIELESLSDNFKNWILSFRQGVMEQMA